MPILRYMNMILYHVSHISNRKSILSEGLRLGTGKRLDKEFTPRLWLTSDPSATHARHQTHFFDVDVWAVNITGMPVDLNVDTVDNFDGNHFYIEMPVPAERLCLMETFS